MSKPKRLRDGDILHSAPLPPCRCGASEYADAGTGGSQEYACKACGTFYVMGDEVERRENADGVSERIHTHFVEPLDDPDDRRDLLRINTGRDDQRPDHDPEADIFRPVCVAQHVGSRGENFGIYTYHHYCGKCRHKMGNGLGGAHGWLYCPYCTARIGNYVFADGVEDWYPDRGLVGSIPDVWEPSVS